MSGYNFFIYGGIFPHGVYFGFCFFFGCSRYLPVGHVGASHCLLSYDCLSYPASGRLACCPSAWQAAIICGFAELIMCYLPSYPLFEGTLKMVTHGKLYFLTCTTYKVVPVFSPLCRALHVDIMSAKRWWTLLRAPASVVSFTGVIIKWEHGEGCHREVGMSHTTLTAS